MINSSNISIRQKLVFSIFLTGLIVSILACTTFIIYEHRSLKNNILNKVEAEAVILAIAVTPALEFFDEDAANNLLQNLAAEPSIVIAAVSTASGEVEAYFRREGEVAPGFPLSKMTYVKWGENNLKINRPIMSAKEVVGTLFIQYDLNELKELARAYMWIMAAILLFLLILTWVIARLASATIAIPLMKAIEKIEAITTSKGDLSMRLDVLGSDEISQLGRAFNIMADEIESHTIDLAKARDEALAANQAKSSFLANMSHEIRTPLTAIIGFSESLLKHDLNQTDTDDAIDTLNRNGRHLLAIINDILDLSKIESKRLEVENLPVYPIEILNEIEQIIGTQARDKGLTFCINYFLPLPLKITSDPTRLKQILLNLCSNALKFTHSGSVQVDVSYSVGLNTLCFAVIDSGIGIPEAKQGHLFQPFTQADSSTNRKYGGTGLGLCISRQLAELLGGSLNLCSNPTPGCRFEAIIATGKVGANNVIYDQSKLAAFRKIAVEEALVPQLCGRVLLAEDWLDNQKLIAMYVKTTGADITVVENGRLAVEKALAEDFDLVLMDIQMPEMDGICATEMLRKLGYSRPIIALTANIMKGDVLKYYDSGFNHCLAKPIDRNLFFRALADHLDPDEVDARYERAEAIQQNSNFEDLAAEFVSNLPTVLADVRHAMEESRWNDFEKLMHVLKGAGGSFGYPKISALCAKIEEQSKAGKYYEVPTMLHELEDMSQAIAKNAIIIGG